MAKVLPIEPDGAATARGAIRMVGVPARFAALPGAVRLGLVALATDLTTERDFARICGPLGITVHVSRIAYSNPTNAENLRRMAPRLAEGAALLLPGETLDAIAYGCTSASVVIGDAEVMTSIAQGKPGIPCVTPIGAALAGLRGFAARRIAVLTPYTPEVSAEIRDFFEGHGLDVVETRCFGLEDDREMARLDPASVVAAAVELAASARPDALFISCTALRAFEVADEIERRIDLPVVTANQALVWGTLRAAGFHDPIPGVGRLFQ